MNVLQREALLSRLAQSTGHVLLVAPTGYGKTILLEQFHARGPGSVLLNATPHDTLRALCERAGTAAALLIDDAHLLPPEEVSALLKLPHEQLRVVLALRHSQYPRVQLLLQRRHLTILNPLDLAFTLTELQQLHEGSSQDLMTRTLGWPSLVDTVLSPFGYPSGYLDDLLNELSGEQRDWLTDVAQADAWDTMLLMAHREGHLTPLYQGGFPIIPLGGHQALHPAMRRHLQENVGLGVEDPPQPDTTLQSLLDVAQRTPPSTLVSLIDGYFERYGEDDSQIALKVQLLGLVPLPELPPTLRDMYAGYLITTGEHQRAEHVLLKQQAFGTDRTRTHVLLAKLASITNHLDVWAQRLELARTRATTEEDWARYYGSQSYLAVRRNDYDQAEEYAQQHLEHAIRSSDLAMHYAGLTNVAYVRQMKGNLLGAMDMTLRGLDLAEREGDRYLPQVKYLMFQLSEVLKDNGQFDQALALIQRALELQVPTLYAVPFLYNTRGLIQMEFGQFEEALVNFDAATELFRERGPIVSLLMTHTYATYALYRLGWMDRIAEHVSALREVVHRIGSGRVNYDEPQAYLPLAEGLALLGKGDRRGALRVFETVALEGRLTYDSVLLTVLMAAKLRVQQGQYGTEHAQLLVEVLDARGSSLDVTAQMYRSDFEEVYRACMVLDVQPERFARILDIPRPLLPARAGYRLHLITMGKIGLIVNGRPYEITAYYPLYALVYLHFKGDWKTADGMGDELYAQTNDGRRSAIKAMSMLRQVLRKLDPELERTLLSPKNDPRGYRVERTEQAHVTVDVEPYLNGAFSVANPRVEDLGALLANVATFMPGLPESEFVQRINRTLEDRAATVALHLAQRHRQAGRPGEAVRALLLSLRFSPTLEVAEALRATVPLLPMAAQEIMGRIVSSVQGDTDVPLGDLITDALNVI